MTDIIITDVDSTIVGGGRLSHIINGGKTHACGSSLSGLGSTVVEIRPTNKVPSAVRTSDGGKDGGKYGRAKGDVLAGFVKDGMGVGLLKVGIFVGFVCVGASVGLTKSAGFVVGLKFVDEDIVGAEKEGTVGETRGIPDVGLTTTTVTGGCVSLYILPTIVRV